MMPFVEPGVVMKKFNEKLEKKLGPVTEADKKMKD